MAEPGENTPEISVENNTLIAISPTVNFSRRIPGEGFQLDEFLSIAEQLHVAPDWLLNSLSNHPDGGITLLLFLQLQFMHGSRSIVLIVQAESRQQNITPQLNVLDDPPDDSHTCVICLETSAETPNQGWATAEGCDTHSFHTECIWRWRGGTCPICRAQLRE